MDNILNPLQDISWSWVGTGPIHWPNIFSSTGDQNSATSHSMNSKLHTLKRITMDRHKCTYLDNHRFICLFIFVLLPVFLGELQASEGSYCEAHIKRRTQFECLPWTVVIRMEGPPPKTARTIEEFSTRNIPRQSKKFILLLSQAAEDLIFLQK